MDQVSQIKQKLDIVDVISSYIGIKKGGHNYKGVCPFHTEKTPSFMVSPELQIYKCFGCGASGDIFKFVEQIEGVDFPKALEILAERAGITLEKQDFDPQATLKKEIYYINELTAKFYQYILLKHTLGKEALTYVKIKRGLTVETIKEFHIGFAPDSWDLLYKFLLKQKVTVDKMLVAGVTSQKQGGGYIDKFKGRIMFPLTEPDGKIAGFTGRTIFNRDPKYLNTSETPVFHKTYFVFGLDKAKVAIKREGAVFVEGQMDLISAYQGGIRNIVSVSGTSLTDNQLKILSRYTKDLTFCFDSDLAGITASQRAIELAEKQDFNIKIAVIPSPYKDLDEIVKADIEGAKKVLHDAISAYDFFLLAALKKHDKNTAFGKKAIMSDLVNVFSKISNPVLMDHYIKKIAEELNLEELTVSDLLKKGKFPLEEINLSTQEERLSVSEESIYKANPEAYFIAVLLKIPLSEAKNAIDKISEKDFLDSKISGIFSILKPFIEDRKKQFNIASVLKLFEEKEELKNLVSELYLWDIESASGLDTDEKLVKDAESIKKRIKKNSAKKALLELSDEIKRAELENSPEKIEKLSKKFERLSKELI